MCRDLLRTGRYLLVSWGVECKRRASARKRLILRVKFCGLTSAARRAKIAPRCGAARARFGDLGEVEQMSVEVTKERMDFGDFVGTVSVISLREMEKKGLYVSAAEGKEGMMKILNGAGKVLHSFLEDVVVPEMVSQPGLGGHLDEVGLEDWKGLLSLVSQRGMRPLVLGAKAREDGSMARSVWTFSTPDSDSFATESIYMAKDWRREVQWLVAGMEIWAVGSWVSGTDLRTVFGTSYQRRRLEEFFTEAQIQELEEMWEKEANDQSKSLAVGKKIMEMNVEATYTLRTPHVFLSAGTNKGEEILLMGEMVPPLKDGDEEKPGLVVTGLGVVARDGALTEFGKGFLPLTDQGMVGIGLSVLS